MDESKETEEIDLRKLNISLDSIDSVCSEISENVKSNELGQNLNPDSTEEDSCSKINDIDKLNISLDSSYSDIILLENNNIPVAKSIDSISTGI